MKKVTGVLLLVTLPLLAKAQSVREISQFFEGWLWIPICFVLSLIAIVLELSRPRKPSQFKNIAENTMSVGQIQRDVKSIRIDLAKRPTTEDLHSLTKKLKQAEDKIDQLEQSVREKELTDLRRNKIETEEANSGYQQAPVQEKEKEELCYAKYADLENGFSSGIVSAIQNGEQVYEIEPNGDTAVYHISADPDAQKYALADFAYKLGNACEFLNEPFKGCRIVMLREGSLIKTSGNWIIQQKIKIEFK